MTPESEKLIAEMYLNQHRMMEEIRALRAQLEGHPGIGEGWMRSSDAAIALKSEGVLNAKHLRKLIKVGVFSVRKGEIRNASEGNRTTWEFNIPACRKALQRYFKGIQAVS
jgi:hypothetical protein